jgi:hypothetical protein
LQWTAASPPPLKPSVQLLLPIFCPDIKRQVKERLDAVYGKEESAMDPDHHTIDKSFLTKRSGRLSSMSLKTLDHGLRLVLCA